MRNWIVLFFVLPLTILGQESITLERAVAIALEQNYDIRIARGNAEIADNETTLGISGFLPTLNASAIVDHSIVDQSRTVSIQGSPNGESSGRTLSGIVSLNWTLFDGFSMFINNSRYHLLDEQARLQLQQSIETQVSLVVNRYLNAARQQQLLEIAQKSLDISRTRLQREGAKKELGGISTTEFLSTKVAFNSDTIAVLNLQTSRNQAVSDLKLVLGIPVDRDIAVVARIDVLPMAADLAGLKNMLQNANSSLALAQAQLKSAGLDKDQRYAPFLPNLSLRAAIGKTYSDTWQTSTGNLFETDTDNQSLGVDLSMNLFNGFRDYTALESASIRERNAELTLVKTRRELETQLENQYRVYRDNLVNYELQAEAVKFARQNLTLFEERYRIGGATFIEYRDAQLQLLRAENALVVSAYQIRTAAIVIEQLTGQIVK
jgi:outer membrane protein